jgi:nucleoside phosphorylase/CheY-like chemotaxis protein
MKKILLIEDDETKRRTLLTYLTKSGVPNEQVIVAKSMTDFAANLNADIGLFIIDLKLPSMDDVAASQNGKAILEAIIKAGKGDALLVAISSYPKDFPELREFYESHGCILSDYSNTKSWQSTLDHLLIQLRKSVTLDFVVFCALQEERNPYVTLLEGKSVIRNGIDCFDIELTGAQGTVVLLPQMGLVNAAVTAALCIDRFSPHIVGMSGICGGFEKRASLGQLLVSSMAYEYQSGKWISDGFMQEPYQVPTDHVTLANLRSLTNTTGLIAKLEEGFSGTRPTEATKPDMGIFTSGSAVIADSKFMANIETIHRKVNGLDMEVFGIQRAAELSPLKPPCICAKSVVDLGDKKKEDKIHAYGAYISAKFLILALEDYFERRASR